MHLYVVARGVLNEIKRWERALENQFLPTKYIHPETKKIEEGFVQLGVRPVQLYEIVFPKEQLNRVLNIVNPSVGSYADRYKSGYKWINRIAKFLGLKKIPKWTPEPITPMYKSPWVGVHGIGIKEDVKHPDNGGEMI